MEQSGYYSSKKGRRAQSANRGSYGTIPRAMPPSGQGDHLDAVEATVIAQGVETARSRQNGHGGNGGEGDRLLGNVPKWNNGAEEEVLTTWQTETKELTKNSIPLVITLGLQYSLTLASVFSAGNLGSDELAAVSLAGKDLREVIDEPGIDRSRNDGKHHRICHLSGIGNRPRHTLCSSLWLRKQASRRFARPENGSVFDVSHDTNCNRLDVL